MMYPCPPNPQTPDPETGRGPHAATVRSRDCAIVSTCSPTEILVFRTLLSVLQPKLDTCL